MTDTRVAAKTPMQILKQDHRTVKELFSEYENLEEGDLDEKSRLFQEINSALTIHATIEEELFYPAVREVKTDEAQDLVNEAVEEHHIVTTLLEELSEMEPGEEQFSAKMKVLRENVEHHAEEEEKEMFPQAKKLPKDVQENLVDRMEALRDELEGKDLGSLAS